MYAHLNINYLQLDTLPKFKDGWAPVLNTMTIGKYFSTTGEVLIPKFSINGKKSGETLQLNAVGEAQIRLDVNWTFPLNFMEIHVAIFEGRIFHSDISFVPSRFGTII
tara:strand:+ start:348 stop:671 length:324 start_codon:yes stop_codon:yes gene_type:complete